MPALANDIYEGLFREHAKRNLERLSLFEPPAPPLPRLPDLSKGKTQFEKLSSQVSYSLNQTRPPSFRSKLRHWVATWLAAWFGEIGALLGAPRIVDFGLALRLLNKWSHENTETIKAAQREQVFGGKRDINWQTTFLPFMESIGMYLQDVQAPDAWAIYRQFKNGGPESLMEDAIKLYRATHNEIDQLAQVWGMRFFPVCDLPNISPEGHPRWDRPYCGIFHTTEVQQDKPFFGLAFKGTNPINLREWVVDFNNFQLIPAAQEYFAGTRAQVSQGVFTGLFGDFPGNDTPYKQILKATRKTSRKLPSTSGRAVPAHVTGHSLGGSYSTLCYTQLLIDVAPSKPGAKETIMGDEYTFGAPRVGSNEWARLASKVPPTTLQPEQRDFHHVDTGVRIWPYKTPAQLPSEIDEPNPKLYPIYSIVYLIPSLIMLLGHLPNRYYESLQLAIADSPKVSNSHHLKDGLNQVPYYMDTVKLLYYTILSYIHNVIFAIASVF